MPSPSDISPVHTHSPTEPGPGTKNENSTTPAAANGACPAVRRRLPDERHGLTHHFSMGGQEGYVTVGLYEDGAPGEMFIRMAKEGSTVSGLMDSFATAVLPPFNTVCHYEFSVTNSATRDLNPAAGLATPKSATPSHLWIIFSAGSNSDSSRVSKESCSNYRTGNNRRRRSAIPPKLSATLLTSAMHRLATSAGH